MVTWLRLFFFPIKDVGRRCSDFTYIFGISVSLLRRYASAAVSGGVAPIDTKLTVADNQVRRIRHLADINTLQNDNVSFAINLRRPALLSLLGGPGC